jgi:mannose-6-phosphate isomerase-like protein (cupin superfamily)
MHKKQVHPFSLKESSIKFAEAKRSFSALVNEDKLTVFQHGTLQIQIFSPAKVARPLPNLRDEIYFVIEGNGELISREKRQKLEQGDFVFVPAGEKHKLEKLSEDFVVWKVSYGPDGGELNEKGLLCPFELFEH